MKFFIKVFLCAVLVMTAALGAAEYFTVSASLANAVEHQTESGLQQHQLVKYALQSGILNASRTGGLNTSILQAVAEQTADSMGVQMTLSPGSEDASDDSLYSNLAQDLSRVDAEEGTIGYQIFSTANGKWLVMTSSFQQSGYTLQLTTGCEVTAVFQEAEQLRERCQWIFLGATLAGALIILVLSWLLTRPIKRLEQASRSFAKGDYRRRIKSFSHDEIGDLTRSFNRMADDIEDKIEALALTVRQREDFVANFAHELKTPMTSIIGYADTLCQRSLTPEQVHEAAGYILNEGMRLESLSFKLMELITLDRQQFLLEELDMKQMLRDVLETAFPAALKRGVKLTVNAEEGYARVEYDLFKTLLLNLLDNAFKSGGSRAELTGRVEGKSYVITVEDNGRGIPADQLRRITEAFYMVDKSRSRKEHGAGLGLALGSKIAAIHGTTLEYDSAEGAGTTVTLRLQRCEEEAEE